MNASLQHTPFAVGDNVNDMLRKKHVLGVSCQCAGSLIILRGNVASFHTKERALNVARQICGMREIVDEIQVAH